MAALFCLSGRGAAPLVQLVAACMLATLAQSGPNYILKDNVNEGDGGSQGAWQNISGKITDFFKEPYGIPVVVVGGVLLIILIVVFISVCCFCCYRRRRRRHGYLPVSKARTSHYRTPDARFTNRSREGQGGYTQVEVGSSGGRRHERTVAEGLRRQKEKKDQADRDSAKFVVEFYLRNDKKFTMEEHLPDMGSRMLKFWFKVENARHKQHLLTIAPVSQKCPLTLDSSTLKTINKLLQMLSHPNLHPVSDVYMTEHHQVIIVQPLSKEGSLKDIIYKCTPTAEWTTKYSRRSRGVSPHLIARYGKQILEALKYLYGQGFPPTGHVQTGNIFVDGNVCRLGGYENVLLGYRTRAYKACREYSDDIDLILFGHVIFEMSCGFELTTIVPGDYNSIRDGRVKEVLKAIFSRDDEGDFTSSINEISEHPFFRDVQLPIQEGARSDHTQFPGEVRNLLLKVAKNKPRVQKTKKRRKKGASSQAPPLPSSSKGASEVAPPSSGNDVKKSESAVLSSIRGDKPKLKKTVTDDRSAPKLEAPPKD